MVAAHREMEALGIGIKAALNFSNPPPVDVGRISVLLVASYHAALAADTLRHVEMKPVLLTRLKSSLRNQRD
jgi:hypothetical protein